METSATEVHIHSNARLPRPGGRPAARPPCHVRSVRVGIIEDLFGITMAQARELVGTLSPREIDVMEILSTGTKSLPTAIKLGISPKTLDIHRANIRRKFRLSKDQSNWRMFDIWHVCVLSKELLPPGI